MLKKSSSRERRSTRKAADGTSIIAPSGIDGSKAMPRSPSRARSSATTDRIHLASSTREIIGTITRSGPHADVRRRARTCSRKSGSHSRVDADRAVPEERVRLARQGDVAKRLVAAHVERPDDDRATLRRDHDLPVDLELLVLARRRVAIDEQHLGAEEADRLSARLERGAGFRGRGDVRCDLDAPAVRGYGGSAGEESVPPPSALDARPLEVVVAADGRRDTGDENPEVGIHDDRAPAQAASLGSRRADQGRHATRSRQDHRVGRRAAVREDEALEPGRVERQELPGRHHVGQADRVRVEDGVVAAHRRAVELAQQLHAHVPDVERPFPEDHASGRRQHRGERVLGRRDGAGAGEIAVENRVAEVPGEFGVARDGSVRAKEVGLDARRGPAEPGVEARGESVESPIRPGQLGAAVRWVLERDGRRNRERANLDGDAFSDARNDRCPFQQLRRGLGERPRQFHAGHRHDGRKGIVAVGEDLVEERGDRIDRFVLVVAGDGDLAEVARPDVEADDAEDALCVRGHRGAAVLDRDRRGKPARQFLDRASRPGMDAEGQRAGEGVLTGHGRSDAEPAETPLRVLNRRPGRHAVHGATCGESSKP